MRNLELPTRVEQAHCFMFSGQKGREIDRRAGEAKNYLLRLERGEQRIWAD